MRKWILAMMPVAIGLILLFATRAGWQAFERAQMHRTHTDAFATSIADARPSAQSASTGRAFGRIDSERKRKILNAAAGCRKVDRFRETASALAGPASADPLASLNAIQRLHFDNALVQCIQDRAARTAPLEEFLIDLANQGNMAAAACYAYGGFRSRRHGVAPRLDPRYVRLVPEWIDSGLAAGSWRMAALAAAVDAPRRAGSPFTHLPPPKPPLEYRYIKLLALGASGEEATDLQSILAEIAKTLTPAERAAADAAALDLFQRYFAQAGPYRRAEPLCENF